MTQIVWQVRKAGKTYGPGMSENVELASPHPFDEFVGQNLPDDFNGEVVRRLEFKDGTYGTPGWVPHISQKEHMQMYAGGGAN